MKTVHLPTIKHLVISGVAAALFGAFMLHLLSEAKPELGKKLFGILLVLVAIRMLIIKVSKNERTKEQGVVR